MNVGTLALAHSAGQRTCCDRSVLHPWPQGSGSRLRGLETGVLNHRAILLALAIGPLTTGSYILGC